MKKYLKRYMLSIIGCIIIGITFNLFFLQYDLVPNGIYGLGALFNYFFNYDPFLFIIIVNTALLIVSWLSQGKRQTQKYILPSILIPIVIFLSENISNFIHFDNIEMILIAIVGGFLTGFGYSIIYKQGLSVGGIEILQDIFNSVKIYRRKTFSYVFEIVIVLITAYTINIESAIYSTIAIVLIKYMATKSKIGISSSKTFFIITSKEKEVKDYIINELHHDLTEFNVKGGFSNTKSKILMTSIDTKEYFRLKQGIDLIDSNAFISIIDSYEVINKNKTLKKFNSM